MTKEQLIEKYRKALDSNAQLIQATDDGYVLTRLHGEQTVLRSIIADLESLDAPETRKAKRIRIVNAPSWTWYANAIGKELNIFEDGDSRNPTHYYVGKFVTVVKEHAEVIEWE